MALSNAERQKNYQRRIKSGAAKMARLEDRDAFTEYEVTITGPPEMRALLFVPLTTDKLSVRMMVETLCLQAVADLG